MPVLPPVPATAQVTMNYTWNGEYVANVFHARNVDEVTAPDLAALGAVFRDWWAGTWRANISSDARLDSIKLVDLTDAASPQLLFTSGLPSTGGVGNDSVPNNAAALIVHGVGVRRRGVNGRTFIVGIPENATAGQELDSGVAAGLQTDFAALKTALLAEGYDFGLVSYYDAGVLRETGLFRNALSSNVQSQLASQKLRLHGRKRHKRRT